MRLSLAMLAAAVWALPALAQAPLTVSKQGGSVYFSRLELWNAGIASAPQSGLGGPNTMSVVPDVDGDGRADLALGAPNVGDAAGAIYVVKGAATLTVLRQINAPSAALSFGAAVAGVPDLTGDGRGDLLVGAPGTDTGAGRAYLYNGATGALVRTFTSPNNQQSGRFGGAVASVPDVNGDGAADLAIGAPRENVTAPDGDEEPAGRVYVYSGATGVLIAQYASTLPYSSPTNFFRASNFGVSLSGLRDADGDGRGDLAIGAPGEWSLDFDEPLEQNYDGRAYVASPATGAARRLRSQIPHTSGDFGGAVAGFPDLNGDGRSDVLIGALDEELNTSTVSDSEGRAYLMSGATGEVIRRFVSPEPADDARFGSHVSLVPDMLLDGTPELLVAETSLCCDKAGALYVFDGRAFGLIFSLEVPYLTFDLNNAIGVPDMDGDGRGDILVGLSDGISDGVDIVVLVSGDIERAEVEPNDVPGEAQRLRGSSPQIIEGTAAGDDQDFNPGAPFIVDGERIEDLFRVDLTAPGLRARVTGVSQDVDLYVLNSAGAVLGSSTQADNANEDVNLPSLPAGTYYIGVDLYGEFGDGSNAQDYTPYTLRVDGALQTAVDAEDAPTAGLALSAPSPNPARATVRLAVTLDAPTAVRLAVLDVLGREVAVLLDGPLPAGTTPARLDVRGLAAGVYTARLETADGVRTQRLTVTR